MARIISSPPAPDSREPDGQVLLLSRTMLSNHELPYVGRFACDWLRLATTDPQTAHPASVRLPGRKTRGRPPGHQVVTRSSRDGNMGRPDRPPPGGAPNDQVRGGLPPPAELTDGPAASSRLRSTSTGMGPGSIPSLPARWRETKSPTSARSSSWARSPSPAARTSMHVGHHLAQHLGHQVEPPAHLGVLGIVAQIDQGDQLAGGVAVLPPAGQLVVAQLGVAR